MIMTKWSCVKEHTLICCGGDDMSRETLIMEKAVELFAKNGIDATSVQDITTACGISKGAFYLVFKSKEELLVAIIDRLMQKFVTNNATVIRKDLPVRERLFQYFLLNFKIFYEYSPFLTIYIREHIRSVNEEIVEKVNELEKTNEEMVLVLIDELLGEQGKAYRYDLLTMVKGFVFSFAFYILNHPKKYDLEKLAQMLVERTVLLAEQKVDVFITAQSWDRISTPASRPTMKTIEKEAALLLEQFAEEPIIRDSVRLLVEELGSKEPRQAIIKGLLKNLDDCEEASWFAYSVEYVSSLSDVSDN